jgi:hypothetical protein
MGRVLHGRVHVGTPQRFKGLEYQRIITRVLAAPSSRAARLIFPLCSFSSCGVSIPALVMNIRRLKSRELSQRLGGVAS